MQISLTSNFCNCTVFNGMQWLCSSIPWSVAINTYVQFVFETETNITVVFSVCQEIICSSLFILGLIVLLIPFHLLKSGKIWYTMHVSL